MHETLPQLNLGDLWYRTIILVEILEYQVKCLQCSTGLLAMLSQATHYNKHKKRWVCWILTRYHILFSYGILKTKKLQYKIITVTYFITAQLYSYIATNAMEISPLANFKHNVCCLCFIKVFNS